MEANISVSVAGLRLSSPTMLASGILGYSKHSFKRVEEHGAGAIVTKSAGLKPRVGHPGPTVVEVPCGLLNAMGLPNPGVEAVGEEVRAAKRMGVRIPIVASVYGFTVEEYVKASEVAAAFADAVELNLSCPTVEGTGVEMGQNPSEVKALVESVKAAVKKPVFAKLSPNVSSIVEVGRAAEEGGADALTAINTVKAMAINVDLMRPVLSVGVGGLSGPSIKPIAVRCVYELYESVGIPIVGCGGIAGWEDAVEMVLAGASAVQLGTGIKYKGLEIFREVNLGIKSYLSSRGFKRLEEIKGLAHKE